MITLQNTKLINDPSLSKNAQKTLSHSPKNTNLEAPSQFFFKSLVVTDQDYGQSLVDSLQKSIDGARFKIKCGQVYIHSPIQTWAPSHVSQLGIVKTDPDYPVKPGERITALIGWKTGRELSETKKVQERNESLLESLKRYHISILYQDGDLLILNKPAGLASHGGSKHANSVDQIVSQTKTYHLLHRLDLETSGILMYAKNPSAAKYYSKMFEGQLITKTYLALVPHSSPVNLSLEQQYQLSCKPKLAEYEGWVEWVSGIKQAPGSKDRLLAVDYYAQDEENNLVKKAVTRVKVISRSNEYSLLMMQPVSGRRHQLRLQALHHLGVPILGDEKYGSPCNRLYLHAYSIQLESKFGPLSVSAPLPKSFKLKDIVLDGSLDSHLESHLKSSNVITANPRIE